MKNKLIFESFSAVDVPQIMSIEQQIYPNPWSEKIMFDCIKAGYQCIKGYQPEDPGKLVCYAVLMMGFEEANLLNIGVAPAYQRQSMGRQLMHRLLLICRINHAGHLWLEVRESNAAAIRLYQSFHFDTIGRRKNYYRYRDSQGKLVKEDALLMSRKVVQP
ncbi:ribosomal protein S18-alanine N-acetyltransferase [Marinicella sediminis]|uniref:[Ribosomal protein bS18]-alanine N-acetyltransferase n=1 Tax=Marinicella sediminis TaxID=1792834 RepID=A0ABV7J9V0_9GAMM|nr:ribosomal protein S18-alanine N-acetyltransferase [Marinicella sediminis]